MDYSFPKKFNYSTLYNNKIKIDNHKRCGYLFFRIRKQGVLS